MLALLSYQYLMQFEFVCKTMDMVLLRHVLTADREFHSLIFLFISETEEAFFNKTTENLNLVPWLDSIILTCVVFML